VTNIKHSDEIIFFYNASHPFSNFHPSKFEVDGHLFHWAEQYIMYRKAIQFGDDEALRRVLEARSPAECKRVGRQVRGFTEEIWATVREQVAFDAVLSKFQRNRKLTGVLLSTGNALLVEASPSDRVWGIGFSELEALDYRHQWGQNLLGQALMDVRARLETQQFNRLSLIS